MGAELQKFTGLANMFDFPEAVQPAAEGCADIRADLVMVKDVWDVSAMVEQQFTVSQICELQHCCVLLTPQEMPRLGSAALLCALGTTRDADFVQKPAHCHCCCISCQRYVCLLPDLGWMHPLQQPCGKLSA